MHEEIYKQLGINIKKHRLMQDLTQQQLADRCSVSLNFLGKIEVAYTKPSFKTIIEISKGLNISLKELFDFDVNN